MVVAEAVFEAGLEVAVVEGVDSELVGEEVEEGFVSDGFEGFCGSCNQGLGDGLAELFDGGRGGFSICRRVGWRRLLLRVWSCLVGGLAGFFWGSFCWVVVGGR